MSEDATDDDFIKIDQMSIDQAAGAFVMIAGAIGSLLLVIWQSKCHCKMNLCYIFQCERRPPNEEEMKGLKEQSEKLKNINKKEDKILDKEDEILDEVESQKGTPRLIPEIKIQEPEPEPQQQSKS